MYGIQTNDEQIIANDDNAMLYSVKWCNDLDYAIRNKAHMSIVPKDYINHITTIEEMERQIKFEYRYF